MRRGHCCKSASDKGRNGRMLSVDGLVYAYNGSAHHVVLGRTTERKAEYEGCIRARRQRQDRSERTRNRRGIWLGLQRGRGGRKQELQTADREIIELIWAESESATLNRVSSLTEADPAWFSSGSVRPFLPRSRPKDAESWRNAARFLRKVDSRHGGAPVGARSITNLGTGPPGISIARLLDPPGYVNPNRGTGNLRLGAALAPSGSAAKSPYRTSNQTHRALVRPALLPLLLRQRAP
ncbi:hypothetical protein WOLCODRAFT_163489 [Wolfiporia cocos MD-104 SS10]|uniref:Uncharacterized protein n=1 Tax=Wolfiporia cocos (strain MD-104) TaxID=742152 RepID=A0A2H3JZ96_WOLCO|nr:hypothetical protein WOLCODRAFT_163489 [Wolfiporia cocos MD-104 SS10]